MAQVKFGGNPVTLAGEVPGIGAPAPAFSLVANNLKDMTLADFAGKRKVLNIVPSLDGSPVCVMSTKKFNETAGNLPNTVVLAISADLPFAMKRFCETEGVKNVVTLSTLRDRGFMKSYGVEIAEGPLAGLAARAVVIIDENDRIIYAELVPDIKNEPDYGGALAALG